MKRREIYYVMQEYIYNEDNKNAKILYLLHIVV